MIKHGDHWFKPLNKSRRFLSFLVLFCLAVSVAANAQNETKLLDASVVPITLKPRSFAPMQVDVTLDWKGQQIITGRLRLALHGSGQVIAIVESQPLSLITGPQTVRLTLPPIVGEYQGFQCRVDAWFVTNDRRIPLSSSIVLLPSNSERNFAIGVVRPPLTTVSPIGDLMLSLRLEDHKPDTHNMELSTSLARLTPETLPTSAEGLCAFDLILIDGQIAVDLDSRERGAIEDWLAAGGSLCVVGDTPDWFGETQSVVLQREGLGRLVLAPAEGIDLNGRAWRGASAFLWKMTANQRESFVETGAWSPDRETLSPMRQQQAEQQRNYYPNGVAGDDVRPIFNAYRLGMPGAEQLLPLLMPASVRMLPFGTVVLILGLFTLAIGPGDYFFLGAVRRRRWTWLLFPLLAIGFAAATIYTANQYMGSTDHRTALIITDVGEDGRVLRENRFEMIFAGSQQRLETPSDSALITAMNHDRLGSLYNQYAYYGYNDGSGVHESVPPIYTGRVPSDYRIVQTVRQWQPQLNREMTIDRPDDAPRVTIFDDFTTESLGGKVTPETHPNLRPDAHLLLYHGEDIQALRRSDRPFRDRLNQRGNHNYQWNYWGYSTEARHQLLAQLSVRQPEGLFSLVSQLSPAGGETFEDLSLLDPTDPDQWLLVAVYEDGDDMHVVRRLFHRDHPDTEGP